MQGKRTRNQVVFQQLHTNQSNRFTNLCHANLNVEGDQMEGGWVQQEDGEVRIDDNRSGIFVATKVDPADVMAIDGHAEMNLFEVSES